MRVPRTVSDSVLFATWFVPVWRECMPAGVSMEDECASYSIAGVDGTGCYCSADKCNSATFAKVTFGVLLMSLLAVML